VQHGKADLQIYRDSSAKIIQTLKARYSSVICERASVDEFYLDATNEAKRILESTTDMSTILRDYLPIVRAAPSLIAGEDSEEMKMSKRMLSRGHAGTTLNQYTTTATTTADVTESNLNNDSNDSHHNPSVHEDNHDEMAIEIKNDENETTKEEANSPKASDWFTRPIENWIPEDLQLLVGAYIIDQLRKDVFQQLGFTCSAGLAENKLLAKLASSMHKPNKQTIVPKAIVSNLLAHLPYNRVQGFGGKLGAEIAALHTPELPLKTMGDFLAYPKQKLLEYFGPETTEFMLTKAAGVDHDPVLDRALPVSLGCSKSFRMKNLLTIESMQNGQMFYWLKELAGEILTRVSIDLNNNLRKPKQLHLAFSLHVVDKKDPNKESKRKNVTAKPSNERRRSSEIDFTPNRSIKWNEELGLHLSKHAKFPSFYGMNLQQVTDEQIATICLNLIQKTISENARVQGMLMKILEYNQELKQVLSSEEGEDDGCHFKQWGITSMGIAACNFEAVSSGKNSIQNFFAATQATAATSTVKVENKNREDDYKDLLAEEKPKKGPIQSFFGGKEPIHESNDSKLVQYKKGTKAKNALESFFTMKPASTITEIDAELSHYQVDFPEDSLMTEKSHLSIKSFGSESIECIELLDSDDEVEEPAEILEVDSSDTSRFLKKRKFEAPPLPSSSQTMAPSSQHSLFEQVIENSQSSLSAVRLSKTEHKNEVQTSNNCEENSEEMIEVFPNNDVDKKMISLYKKYLSSSEIDLSSFLSLPEDIQMELVNQNMFENGFSMPAHVPSHTSKTGKSPSLQQWFPRVINKKNKK
jgi:nucleotidyltransferase/DNA polymerase involved in DNA repair